MRKILIFAFCILATVLLWFSLGIPISKKQEHFPPVQTQIQKPSVELNRKKVLTAEEQKDLDDLLFLLEKLQREGFKSDQEQTAYLLEFERLNQKALAAAVFGSSDFIELLNTYCGISHLYRGAGDEDSYARVHSDCRSIADNLIREFPDRVDAILAWIGAHSGDENQSSLESIGALAHCLSLEPSQPDCRKIYDQLVADYSAPHCGQGREELGIFLASERADSRFSVEATIEGQLYYLSNEPILTGADFESLSLSKAENLFTESTVLNGTLTEKAAETLKNSSRENIGKVLVVALGERILMTPRIQSTIEQGTLQITLPNSETALRLEDFCGQITRREIPQDLRR